MPKDIWHKNAYGHYFVWEVSAITSHCDLRNYHYSLRNNPQERFSIPVGSINVHNWHEMNNVPVRCDMCQKAKQKHFQHLLQIQLLQAWQTLQSIRLKCVDPHSRQTGLFSLPPRIMVHVKKKVRCQIKQCPHIKATSIIKKDAFT